MLQGPGWYGHASDTFEPSDSSIAAGPFEIVQASNRGIRIHSARTTDPVADDMLFDISLADFFLAQPDEVIQADPRVVYAGRWFISALSAACGPGYSIGITYLAVSSTSNLLDGGWTVYSFAAEGGLFDYPTLGISSDKVAIGTNVFAFSNCAAGGYFGADLLVLSRADVMNGVAADFFYDDPDGSLFTNMPAVNMTNDGAIHVVSAFASDGDVAYFTVTGSPDSGTTALGAVTNVTTTESLPAFGSPPAPRQPGSPGTIADAVDGRPTDALWAEGRLYFPSTTNCTPVGDSAERACARVTTLITATGDVFQDFTIEVLGADTFTPGIALPWALPGPYWLWVTYAQSSTNDFVSVFEALQGNIDGTDPVPNQLHGAALLVAGRGTYTGTRWGDYHQLGAWGPSVWQASQFPTESGGWATWISRLDWGGAVPPNGTVKAEQGRTSTIYRQVQIRTAPTSAATQVLLSNSPTTSGGVLTQAALYPPGAALPWLLDDPTYGGNSATGTKTVYVQFGYDDGIWSAVKSDAITLVAGGVKRLAGADRYATGGAISSATFNPLLPTVFLASGLNFPDALAGGAVAGQIGAPILLAQTNLVPNSTCSELGRLQPAQIVVLGGSGVISDAAALLARDCGGWASDVVYRIGGANRYETAAAISSVYFHAQQTRVYVATGTNFPDALAGAAAAAHLKAPLLLVTPTAIPAPTAAELTRLDPDEIVVLGGTGAVSNTVKNALGAYCGCTPQRIGGANRYETAALIAHDAWTAQPGFDDVEAAFIATGANFPDALSGTPAAGLHGAPLLLVTATTIPTATATELNALGPDRIFILGSTGVVSSSVASGLLAYADEP